MDEIDTNKKGTPAKSFLTVGPTLHYSHSFVTRCWVLTLVTFIFVCYFWNRLLNGGVISVDFVELSNPAFWNLGRYVVDPISIYAYPWHIMVLGSLMGLITIVPVLTSLLLSFRHSVPLLLSIIFLAKLPLFGIFMLVSCIATACRPLRFRSRFITILLCLSPALVYWGVFGGHPTPDPIRWAITYSPWVYAWLTGLAVAGIILGIGHYTRYKPGLIWLTSIFVVGITYGVFHWQIGFAEVDYQSQVAGNNPEEVVEFHDHSLSQVIDDVIKDENMRSYLSGVFYPAEPIMLRKKLKEEIQSRLSYERWPTWLDKRLPDELKYQSRRQSLLFAYESFINKWKKSKRLPIALYYKALVNEYHPDIRYFASSEVLRFYSDYPYYDNLLIWQELFERFPQSPESIEARYRMAMHFAGQGKFDKALGLLDAGKVMLRERAVQEIGVHKEDTFLAAFHRPAETVMTEYKLSNLWMKMQQLEQLLCADNQGQTAQSQKRLATFVMLNPNAVDYELHLDQLLEQLEVDDPLRDNLLLEKMRVLSDANLRARGLQAVSVDYVNTDGGVQAMYELAMLKIQMWKDGDSSEEIRKGYLKEASVLLNQFIKTYPDSIYADRAAQMMSNLPMVKASGSTD